MNKILTNKGLSIVEMMVVMGILGLLMGGVYMSLIAGEETWMTSDAQMELNNNLRLSLNRISTELSQSSSNRVTIVQNTGTGSSDILQFKIPILCSSTSLIMDASGNVTTWGAPLTWGCTTSSCMNYDDDSCATVGYYSQIEYLIDSSNRLVRRIYNQTNSVVQTDIFALNITNMQITTATSGVNIVLTATMTTARKRTMSASETMDVYLRNRG